MDPIWRSLEEKKSSQKRQRILMGCSFFRNQEEICADGDLNKIKSLNINVQQKGKGCCYLPHLWPAPSQSTAFTYICLSWRKPLIGKMMTIMILSSSHCWRNIYVSGAKLVTRIISKPLPETLKVIIINPILHLWQLGLRCHKATVQHNEEGGPVFDHKKQLPFPKYKNSIIWMETERKKMTM